MRVAAGVGRGRARYLGLVTVEMLLRTGLRDGEYVSLRADAMVPIGAGPWLHVPVGKLREDRYLTLHPHLAALIDDYRARYVGPANLLLPRENGKSVPTRPADHAHLRLGVLGPGRQRLLPVRAVRTKGS